MKLNLVHEVTAGVPIMTPEQGRVIYDFILEKRLSNILELGVYHGVSTCYIAAALDELGGGRLVAVDNQIARDLDPDADMLLKKLGLRHLVELHYEDRSYTWFMQRHMERHSEPVFDFCYLDGAHTWDTDGFAFFLVAMSLQPEGWIILDDLDWSISGSPRLKDPDYLRDVLKDPDFLIRTPKEEQETRQVRKIWELLVTRHPDFGDFRESGSWAYAKKIGNTGGQRHRVVVDHAPFAARLRKIGKRFLNGPLGGKGK